MGKGNAWTQHVTKYYKLMKQTNPEYKFKNALRDAKSTFKRMPNPLNSFDSISQSQTKKHRGTRHHKMKSRRGTRRR